MTCRFGAACAALGRAHSAVRRRSEAAEGWPCKLHRFSGPDLTNCGCPLTTHRGKGNSSFAFYSPKVIGIRDGCARVARCSFPDTLFAREHEAKPVCELTHSEQCAPSDSGWQSGCLRIYLNGGVENGPEPEVCSKAAVQESRIYNRRRSDPRPWNRGEHRHLQRCPRGTAGAAAVQRS